MEFTFRITSSMELKVRTGITGPKISSCITASSKVTWSMTVGSICKVSGRAFPPQMTFAGSIRF